MTIISNVNLLYNSRFQVKLMLQVKSEFQLKFLIAIKADTEDVAFLVVGDVFGATTHSDLVIRCIDQETLMNNLSIWHTSLNHPLSLYYFKMRFHDIKTLRPFIFRSYSQRINI